MDPARYEHIVDTFEAASALPVEQRDAWLTQACAGDDDLRHEIELMLAATDDHPVCHAIADELAADLVGDQGSLAAGDTLGDFTLTAALGAGGMAAVWLARQHEPPRDVALKVLHPWWLGTAAHDRFRFEARALARLTHPAFPVVHLASAETERPYIAMELVQGVPLDAWVAAHTPDADTRLRMLIAVAQATREAHAAGLVHRDLKPANVLVQAHGVVRVIDLGVGMDASDPEHVQAQRVGTQGWSSPEQAAGRASPRSDVYAIGRLGNLLLLDASGRPAPPLSPDVAAVLRKATADDPAARYVDAAALAADLERAQRHQPVSAIAPTPAYRLRTWGRRHAAALTRAGLVTAAVGLVAVAAWMGDARARARQEHEALAALAPLVDAARTAAPHAAADLRAFLSQAGPAAVRHRGWLALAQVHRDARRFEDMADALAEALAAARTPEEELAVFQPAARTLADRWKTHRLRLLAASTREALDDHARALVDAANWDFTTLAATWPADDPRHRAIGALRYGARVDGGLYLGMTSGGQLYSVSDDRASLRHHRADPALTVDLTWSLSPYRANWPRLNVLDATPPVVLTYDDQSRRDDVALRLHPDGRTERIAAWPFIGVHAVAPAPDGGWWLAAAVPGRALFRWDPDADPPTPPAVQALAALASDTMDVLTLDADGTHEVYAAQGPWWAYGVHRLDDGGVAPAATASLAYVNDIEPVRTPAGPLIAALVSHRYRNPHILGAETPYGPPAGVALLHPEDLHTVHHLSLPAPTDAPERVGYVQAWPGDVDGDGLEDLVVLVDGTPGSHTWVLLQQADGGFVNLLLPDLYPMAAVDLDGDGDAEVIAREPTGEATWILGTGSRPLPPRVPGGAPAALVAPTQTDTAIAAWRRADQLEGLAMHPQAARHLLTTARAVPPDDRVRLAARAADLAADALLPNEALQVRSLIFDARADAASARALLDAALDAADVPQAVRAAAYLPEDPRAADVSRYARSTSWSWTGRPRQPDNPWSLIRPAALRVDVAGQHVFTLLNAQHEVGRVALRGAPGRVGLRVELSAFEVEDAAGPTLGVFGDGPARVGVGLFLGVGDAVYATCLFGPIDDEARMRAVRVAPGPLTLAAERVGDTVSCVVTQGDAVTRQLARALGALGAPDRLIIGDAQHIAAGQRFSTGSTLTVSSIELWGTELEVLPPTEPAPDAQRALLAALAEGRTPYAEVAALLATDVADEVRFALLRTASPRHLAALQAAHPPGTWAPMLVRAWSGTAMYAPPDRVVSLLDHPWLDEVSPADAPTGTVRSELASALLLVGDHARAADVLAPVVDDPAYPGLTEVERARALVLRARAALDAGDVDTARQAIARARAIPQAARAVQRLVDGSPSLSTLDP